jgi:abortive infection bacteriophage resistance protein
MKQPYTKPALTLDQKIANLRLKGMIIFDEAEAKRCLQHISYYRLSAYWLPFEHPKNQHNSGKCFRSGTDFGTVVALHTFDRTLRRLVTEAIEEIEISVCGNWAYCMAMLGDGFSYLDPSNYADTERFESNRERLAKDVAESKETFVQHFRDKYLDELPPVWMTSEILSFGSLSHWYANLKHPPIRQAIAEPYGLDETVFRPFLHHLSVVRNICAHHSRLWNRVFKVRLKLPSKQPKNLATSLNPSEPQKIYNTLTMLVFVLGAINDATVWRKKLMEHIATLPCGDVEHMGFPLDWCERPIWNQGNLA